VPLPRAGKAADHSRGAGVARDGDRPDRYRGVAGAATSVVTPNVECPKLGGCGRCVKITPTGISTSSPNATASAVRRGCYVPVCCCWRHRPKDKEPISQPDPSGVGVPKTPERIGGCRVIIFQRELTENDSQIRLRAFERWQARGCPHGSDQEDWFTAEEDIRSGHPSSRPST
jgi:hypothetical protein